MPILAKNPSKRGENEFLGKKRKRHSLKFPNTKLHAKNQKNLFLRWYSKTPWIGRNGQNWPEMHDFCKFAFFGILDGGGGETSHIFFQRG